MLPTFGTLLWILRSFANIFHIWLQKTFLRAETTQERTLGVGANRSELTSSFVISYIVLSSFNKDLLSAYYVPGIMLGAIDAKEPISQWRELALKG